jgi:F-box/leucine-rich repeat protein 10/11
MNKEIDEFKWSKILQNRKFPKFDITSTKGSDITFDFVAQNKFKHPILIDTPQGLGMKLPENLTVDLVAELCGKERMVDVIQVSTQTDIQMTLGDWADYFKLPKEKRTKLLNVISLEFRYYNFKQ